MFRKGVKGLIVIKQTFLCGMKMLFNARTFCLFNMYTLARQSRAIKVLDGSKSNILAGSKLYVMSQYKKKTLI